MVVKKKSGGSKSSSHSVHEQSIAILALILNIVILPGLGSLIGGKTKVGVWQIVLFLGGLVFGAFLTFSVFGAFVGIPLMILGPIVSWVWGIVTGAKLVREAHI